MSGRIPSTGASRPKESARTTPPAQGCAPQPRSSSTLVVLRFISKIHYGGMLDVATDPLVIDSVSRTCEHGTLPGKRDIVEAIKWKTKGRGYLAWTMWVGPWDPQFLIRGRPQESRRQGWRREGVRVMGTHATRPAGSVQKPQETRKQIPLPPAEGTSPAARLRLLPFRTVRE